MGETPNILVYVQGGGGGSFVATLLPSAALHAISAPDLPEVLFTFQCPLGEGGGGS